MMKYKNLYDKNEQTLLKPDKATEKKTSKRKQPSTFASLWIVDNCIVDSPFHAYKSLENNGTWLQSRGTGHWELVIPETRLFSIWVSTLYGTMRMESISTINCQSWSNSEFWYFGNNQNRCLKVLHHLNVYTYMYNDHKYLTPYRNHHVKCLVFFFGSL